MSKELIQAKITQLQQDSAALQNGINQMQINLYGTQGAIQVLQGLLKEIEDKEAGEV